MPNGPNFQGLSSPKFPLVPIPIGPRRAALMAVPFPASNRDGLQFVHFWTMSIFGSRDKRMNNQKSSPAETEKAPPLINTSRFAPANRKRLSPPALRTFLAIADLWGLTEEQRLLVLGYPSRSTYHNWCKQAREHGAFTLDVDVLARISAVLGIHQALGILFPTERLGAEWLRTAHSAVIFGGRPPLDLVTSGSQDGLLSVRRFLDGARGGLYMQPNTIDEAFTPYSDTEIVFR
jgi:Protein of unknown function (DUF2384)